MFHAISAAWGRLARPITARLARADEVAAWYGWQVTTTRFGGRRYRDPRFGQLATARPAPAPAPGTWAQAATAARIRALGAVPVDTGTSPVFPRTGPNLGEER